MQNYRMSEPMVSHNTIDNYPIAMAYVPWQNLTEVYQNLQEAFNAGTLFPELNKPFTGRRCVK